MSKSLLSIRWRNILYAPLFLSLIVSIVVMGVSANPEVAQVSVDPLTVSIQEVGENTTVAINVSDVSNLYGYGFHLSFNTILLDAIEVTIGPVAPPEVFIGPRPPPDFEWKPIYDEEGLVKVVVTFLSGPAFSGSGILAYITFNGTAPGVSDLDLLDDYTFLRDPYGDTIPSLPPVDGEINVMPEFPASIVMHLLLIATLAATFLGKIVWSRKRRDPTIA